MKPKSAPIIAAYDLQIMEFGKYSARLPMSEGSAYFNSGVLVMDLNASGKNGSWRARASLPRSTPICVPIPTRTR